MVYQETMSALFKNLFKFKKAKNRQCYLFNQEHFDLSDGYEVLSSPPIFLGWDTTYAELERLGICRIVREEKVDDLVYYYFLYPVRLGSLIIEGLYARHCEWIDKDKMSVVRFYHYDFIDESEILMIKNTLIKSVAHYPNTAVKVVNPNFNGKNHTFYISLKGIEFDRFSFSLSFDIRNNRDFAGIRQNQDYETVINIDRLLLLDKHICINADYKKSKYIKRIPPKLVEQYPAKPLVWQDDVNGVVGIADWQNAVIIPKQKLKRVVLFVARPAKGSGYSILRLDIDDEKFDLYKSKYNDRKIVEISEQLADFLGIQREIVEMDDI